MKRLVIFILFLIIIYGCNSRVDLRFEKWDSYSSMQNIIRKDTIVIFNEAYIIHGYKDNNKIEKLLDSFFCERVALLDKRIDQYHISLYKISKKTNLKNLKKHPNDYFYSDLNDLIWSYDFYKRFKYIMKTKINKYQNKTIIEMPDCSSKTDSL